MEKKTFISGKETDAGSTLKGPPQYRGCPHEAKACCLGLGCFKDLEESFFSSLGFIKFEERHGG